LQGVLTTEVVVDRASNVRETGTIVSDNRALVEEEDTLQSGNSITGAESEHDSHAEIQHHHGARNYGRRSYLSEMART
jgi:hypothetical protein